MTYNEHLVEHIDTFRKSVERQPLSMQTSQKLLSVLHCLEYQVEEGDCPKAVITSLQNAMLSWIETTRHSSALSSKLNECITAILNEI